MLSDRRCRGHHDAVDAALDAADSELMNRLPASSDGVEGGGEIKYGAEIELAGHHRWYGAPLVKLRH